MTGMKGFVSLLFFISLCFTGWSQDQKHAVMLQFNSIPERNTHGYNPFGGYWDENKDLYTGPNISVKDHSFSTGLGYYTYHHESMLMRARAGIIRTDIHSAWNYEDASFNYSYDATKTEMDLYIAPAISKIFTVSRFNYFAGVELPVTIYGRSKVRKLYSYSTLGSGDLRYSSETSGDYSNGFSAGLGAFGGFSVKFFNNLTFGPEAGFAFLFSDYGGRGAFTSVTTDGSTFTQHVVFSRRYRQMGVSGLQGSLNLTWWF